MASPSVDHETRSAPEEVAEVRAGAPHPGPVRPPARTRLRALAWILAALLASLPLAMMLTVLFLESEHGRAAIVSAAAEEGLALDYEQLIVRPIEGRLELRGLRLPSPASFAETDWLSIGRFEARWSTFELLRGELHLTRIQIERIRAHVVVDEEGRDSVSAALSRLIPTDETPSDPALLSQTLANLQLPVRIDELTVSDVRAELTQTITRDHVRHVTLEGLELRGSFREAARDLALELVSPERTYIAITEHHGEEEQLHEVDLQVVLELEARDGETLSLDWSVTRLGETLLPLPTQLIALTAAMHFQPGRGTTQVEITRLALLDDIARLALAFSLDDGSPLPRAAHGEGSIALDPLVAFLPAELGIRADGARIEWQVRSDEAASAIHGHVQGDVAHASVGVTGGELEIESMHIDVELDLEGDSATLDLQALVGSLVASARIEELGMHTSGDRLEVDGVELELRVPLRGEPTFDPALIVALGIAEIALEDGTHVRSGPLRLELTLREIDPALVPPLRFEARATLPRLEMWTPERERVRVERLELSSNGRIENAEHIVSLALGVRAGELRGEGGDRMLDVRAPDLRLELADVRIDAARPLASAAQVSLRVSMAGASARDGTHRYLTDRTELSVRGSYAGHTPSTFSGSVSFRAVQSADGEGSYETVIAPGELAFSVRELSINHEVPLRSSGNLHASGRFAPFELELDGALRDGNGEGTLHVHVDPLRALSATLTSSSGIELDHATLELRARGAWRGLDGEAPSMDHHAELTIRRTGISRPGLRLELPRVLMSLDHRGSGAQHHGTLGLTIDRPVLNGARLEEPFTLEARGSLDEAVARIDTRGGGPSGFDASAHIEATLAPDVLRHSEQLTLSGLSVLGEMIPSAIRDEHPVDFGTITLELAGDGTVSGLPEERPFAFRQGLRATATGLRYHPSAISIASPEARIDLSMEGDEDHFSAVAEVRHERIDVEDPVHHHVTIHGFHETVRFESRGALSDAQFSVALDGRIERVEQDLFAAYPMEDLTLEARIAMNGRERIELERFIMENRRGGTRLELTKSLERARRLRDSEGEQRRISGGDRFLLRGQLTQDLARLDASPETLRARGRVTMPFSLESGDGSLFQVHATMELEDLDLEVPEIDLEVRGLHAVVPLEETLEWTSESGLVVVSNTERNAFSRVRFQDVQPFLNEESHLEIAHLRMGPLDAGPIHGSLQIDRNVFSVNGLRVERGDALITGQLLYDYLAGAQRVQFRGNITGLRLEGSDEPLDANAAIVLDPERLEIDGRVQIVRIGSSHLVRLINMLDPYHENPSLSSLRGALDLGYPQRVGIALQQGLMSMQVELGGYIGSLLQIGEIQGIAVGPFMTRHVAPYLPASD